VVELDRVTDIATATITAYATYDQGSMKKIEGENPSFISIIYNSWPVIFGYIAYFIVLAYIYTRINRWRKRKFFSKIQEQLMEVRTKLKERPYYDEAFDFTVPAQKLTFYEQMWKAYTFNKTYRWQNNNLIWQTKPWIKFKRSFLHTNVLGFVIVDDLYSRLGERDYYIRKNEDNEIDLVEQNKKILELAEDALEKTDWSKYV